jgi:hypothetical protein
MLLPNQLARMRLGCRLNPSVTAYAGRAGASIAPALPAWSRIVTAPRVEGHNDTIGDCVETAGFNAVQTLLARAGNDTQIPNALVPAVYTAVTGYNPANPATDQGTDPEAFFAWWGQSPIAGYKLGNLTRLNPQDEAAIRQTIATTGGVFLCVELAVEQQNQLVWTATGTPGTWGGHAIWCDSFEADLTFATSWGEVKPIDRSYFEKGFVQAAYGLELVAA